MRQRLDLDDIQGIVLRGSGMGHARYFALKVNAVAVARSILGKLAASDSQEEMRISSSAPWTETRPRFVLNAGITYQGFKALGLPDDSLASFPDDFRGLTPERAARIGDVDESAPSKWLGGFAPMGDGEPLVDVILFLFARSDAILEEASATVRKLIHEDAGFTELYTFDGRVLPHEHVHFGFRDGISQPTVEGGPRVKMREMQDSVATGEFILGFDNENGFQNPVPQPRVLGLNGTYGAFRVLQQDVVGFEQFLTLHAGDLAAPDGVDSREWLAAKMCGRWRSGAPLSLSPKTETPTPPLAPTGLNFFDYVKNDANPALVDDKQGFICPRGSHIRRCNPRSSLVAGGSPNSHRLIRRGIPYGPVYDPVNPNVGEERGLMGLFIGASITDQFEFVMSQWVNGDGFGLRGDLDPLVGRNPAPGSEGRLLVPTAVNPPESVKITGLNKFVTTRAHAYCFLPSLSSLRFLATL